MKKPQTNTQFINHLMNYSQQGALIQAFVLTALEKYAESIKTLPPEGWTTEMISFDGWQRCAEETLTKLEAHYKQS